MAEHLQHSLVREGFPVRPLSIQTLAAFLDRWSPLAKAPEPLVQLCMERALARLRPARFQPVVEFPGVVRALASLFGEVSGSRMPDDVARLFADVERQLAAKGMAPRHARLTAAAARIANNEPLPPQIVFHGFFKLSAGEATLIAVLARRTEITITLPDGPGAERAREALRSGGFEEHRIPAKPSAAQATLFTAATMEREIEEIAGRIVQEAANGRPFREIGIVLRVRDPYGPLVETTLARFGIPARSYFADPLAAHPQIQFLSGLCRSALNGRDHVPLLSALRMPVSGLGATKAGDERDFAMRLALPASGWPDDIGLATGGRLEAADWASRLKRMRFWLPELAVEDRAGHDRVQAWRSTAAALAAFEDALDATVLAFDGEGRIPFATFWKQAESVLAQEPLRVRDARRNVVHILDVYEARLWSLPLVFVPGLLERHFPQHHRENAIVGDAALQRAGLDTAVDREREESLLFHLATTRATEETVLSYPRFDESGQETLRSFFLPATDALEPVSSVRPRPVPKFAIPKPSAASIDDPRLAAQHKTLSASSIETYLQCPFQFFARKTLRLKERPKAPRDRLDFLLQGSIFHHALAEWTRMPLLGSSILDQAFEQECAKSNVPRTYRTEAVRLELLRHFEAFIRDEQVVLGWQPRVEEEFQFTLQPGLSLRGRVDRVDVHDGRALVIDYKYSAEGKLNQRIKDSATGDAVQAGVYLLAAERAFGLQPIGMLFCHLKKGVNWNGWHAGLGLDVGENMTVDAVYDLATAAEQTVLRVHQEISSGRIAVSPKDDSKCDWCECRDICRIESIERITTAVGR